MYRRMLVATGDHPWTSAAVSYGIALAAQTGAEVCFLRGLALPLMAGTPDTCPGSAILMESLVEHSETILSWVATAAEQADIPYTTVLRWGRITEAILWTAAEENCDLIVVGAPLRPGWQHLLRGSIARRVAMAARHPVLVVKQPLPHPETVLRWSRVMVITDGSPSADTVLEHALTLAQAADLDVFHLYVESAGPAAKTAQIIRRAPEVCILAAAQAAAAGIPYEGQIASGQMLPTILRTAAQSQCDVIMLGVSAGTPWQRLRRERLSRAVAARASCPVLLVPALPGVPDRKCAGEDADVYLQSERES